MASAAPAAPAACAPGEPPAGASSAVQSQEIARSAVAYLRARPGVRRVRFDEADGCSSDALAAWHAAHAPRRLPDDLQAFLGVANGVRLTWDFAWGDEEEGLGAPPPGASGGAAGVAARGVAVPVGCARVNALEAMVPVQLDAWPEDDPGGWMEGAPPGPPAAAVGGEVAAFCLDGGCTCGRVALVYGAQIPKASASKHKGKGKSAASASAVEPSVWFVDLGCQWNFIAASFGDYFRLMISHLGLPHWQYAFTEWGLDPVAQQWLRYLAPERLALITKERKRRKKKGQRKARRP